MSIIAFIHDIHMRAPVSLDGKTAVATGGASGIGFCVAQVLMRAGALMNELVHILDLSAEAVSKALNEMDYE